MHGFKTLQHVFLAAGILAVSITLSGCTTLRQNQKMQQLQNEVSILKHRLNQLRKERQKEVDKLEEAKTQLADTLRGEIADYRAKLEMTERGLVVTFLDEIFFDSGKATIKPEAEGTLRKVSGVLKNEVPGYLIVIEGHTDNIPIKYSRWRSNWELASARALSVLHYFIEEGDIQPERISAHSYGEFTPVADNSSPQGRRQNRRVEVVITTQMLKKIREDISRSEEEKADISR